MDSADVLERERSHPIDLAAHDLLEAVVDPEHLHPLQEGADGRGADDAVDARGGAATYQDCELLRRHGR